MNRLDLQIDAGYIKRYHTFPIMGEQTVGQHTYGVAQFVRAITGDKCSAELLMAALDHDVAEQHTGDIPFTAKVKFDNLKTCVTYAEHLIENEYDLGYSLSTEEDGILKLADLLEMGYFGLRQMGLGNHYAEQIVQNILTAMAGRGKVTPMAATLINRLEDTYHECKR